MKSKPSENSQTFAVILTWPDIKNAEYEVVQRICIAAKNIDARVTIVNNDGYPIWSTFKNISDDMPRIDRSEYSFVISLHFESPRLFDIYSYAALWNPLDYYFMFGYDKSATKLASHNSALSCDASMVDNHAINLFEGLGRSLGTLPQLFHSVPEPYMIPNITPEAKLFYIGINWERLGGPKGRHHALLEQLDEEGLITIYGPELFQGGRPWEGFKTFKGPIPFDGSSVVKKLNEAGICLVFSSKPHQSSGIMSNRLFESLAAGAVAICNRHPIIEKYFKDCVYILDDDVLDDEDLKDAVRAIILSIRKNPEEALRRARVGQQRLKEMFSLERSLEAIFEDYDSREKQTRRDREATKEASVMVVLCYTKNKRKEFKTLLANLLRQTNVQIDIVYILDKRFSDEISDLIESNRSKFKSIRVEVREFYGIADFRTRSARRLCGTGPIIWSVIREFKGDFFSILRADDHWFSDHLSSLISAFNRMPSASVAASGLLIETIALDGRKTRRLEELTFTGYDSIVNVVGPCNAGRFLYQRNIIKKIRSETMTLLDGEETLLLNLAAILSGEVCQTNYATYVLLEHEQWKLSKPIAGPEQQRQFIRDSIAGDPLWQALRSRAVPAPPFVFASEKNIPLRWEHFSSPMAIEPLIKLNYCYPVTKGGEGLKFLGKGFSFAEEGHVWVEDHAAEIKFRMLNNKFSLILHLNCFSITLTDHYAVQGVTVMLNDFPVSYANVHNYPCSLQFPLPSKICDNSEDFKLTIVPDFSEQVRNHAGEVIDERHLSVAIIDFALVAKAPIASLEEIYYTKRDGNGLPYLLSGFSSAEPDGVWVDGKHASLVFSMVLDKDTATDLVLVVDGRSTADGKNQKCVVEIDEQFVREFRLNSAYQELVVPLSPPFSPHLGRRVDLYLAFADPVIDESGEVSDPRLLSMVLRNFTIKQRC